VGGYARHLLDCFGRDIDLYRFEPLVLPGREMRKTGVSFLA